MEAISNIEKYTSGTSCLEDFSSNRMLCHAVVYNVQCIGESVYMLSREFIESHPEVPWKSIEGQRHILVHDYYAVSFGSVWNVVMKDLPELKSKVQKYLKET